MRKILVGMIALLASTMTLWAERVSEEDAALVANNFMNVRPSSSAAGVRTAAPGRRMVRKSTKVENESQYYVYENADGEGWVIIAANDVVRPVLAYSETGHFNTENMPSNLRKWMVKYDHYITRLEEDSITAGEETESQWNALRKSPRATVTHTPVVGPLIQTQWDQGAPYNNLCPGTGNDKAYTGCVATAMAQVMNYWQWPEKGMGKKSYRPLDPNNPYDIWNRPNYSSRYPDSLSADFENTTYNWSAMRKTYSSIMIGASAAKTAVATLMYHCGVATEMMYGNEKDGGSGTYTNNLQDWTWGTPDSEMSGGCAQNALWYYFRYKKSITAYMRDGYSEKIHRQTVYIYDSWTDEDWTAMLKAELDKKHPILYSGGERDENGNSTGGHSFICDGYDKEGYFHFNWGWSGEADGYFLLSALNPGYGGAGGGNYQFSEDQDVIIGIEPDRPEEPQREDTEALENNEVTVPASKVFDGNQVVIIRDGKKYDLMGRHLK